MKKICSILLIILCILCITGCGSISDTKKSNEEPKKTYTRYDLMLYSDYEKINEYLNGIFDELDFVGKMKQTKSNERGDSYTFTYSNKKADTIFTFYFDKDETFMFVNIIYDKYNSDSKDLAREVIKYSKFGFTLEELQKIREIIVSYDETQDTIIGNYIVSNASKGNLTIKSKEKYGTPDQKEQNKTQTDNKNNNNNSNSNNSNNSTNNKRDTNSNNNSSNNNISTQVPSTTPTPEPTPAISVSKQNALRKAKDYLSLMAFSRDGLIHQLEFEGFSNEDSVYGVDNSGANWNQQALNKAKDYLEMMAFSYSGLIKQLEFEKFTHDQALYGVNNCGANWNQQAVKKAKDYLEMMAFSHDGLVHQLEFEGFTREQAEYGVSQIGL